MNLELMIKDISYLVNSIKQDNRGEDKPGDDKPYDGN